MRYTTLVALFAVGALGLAGFVLADDMGGMNMDSSTPPATQPADQPATPPATRAFSAVDVGNTRCPISGEKVGDSKLVEVYNGKVYHLCCPDCPKEFEADPAKVAKAVADNPAKYGIK